MFTNTFLPHVGGVARSVRTFLEEYRRAGHRVLVVAPEFADGRAPRSIERSVERVPAWRNFNGSDFSMSLPLGPATDERIAMFKPEIVHAQHPFLLGDSALRVGAQYGLPVVFTHHTLYEQYTHYLPVDSVQVREFVAELATRFANCCDGVIAPSSSIARLLKERGVISRIETIPTGIGTREFAAASREPWRRRLALPDDAVLIGHIGRLATEKNLPFLADALARCLSREENAHALIVGEGPARGEIEAILQRRSVASRVHFAGRLTGRSWREAYAAMDLFAFSSHSETQGMVLAEAMAAGVPVVALDASGVRDVLRDGVNGRMLSTDASSESMARVLTHAVRHRELRERWARGARRTAGQFDRRLTGLAALKFYRQLIDGHEIRPRANDWDIWWQQFRDRLAIEGRMIGDKVAAITHAIVHDSSTMPRMPAAG